MRKAKPGGVRTKDLVTAGDWKCEPHGDGWHITTSLKGQYCRIATVHGMRGHDAYLIAASKDLLVLARQYASECGDCAGTRVTPDDKPCMECRDIWAVIDKAEHRS